jgi:hypothetical protein
LNATIVDALSSMHTDNAYSIGKKNVWEVEIDSDSNLIFLFKRIGVK